ncbi:MAG: molybdate ABC transporter substrate-binding protein [Roseburia inulinivorans]
MMKKLTAVLLLTAMTAGLAACGSNKGADTNTDAPVQNEGTEETVTTETSGAAQNADIQGTITLAAAASLEKSFTEHLIPMFEEQYPEVSIEGTYDSSGKLQSQIEAGADVDIFFSAALKQMEALQEEGYIAEDASVDLLENKIVLIVPAGKESGYTSFEDIVNADMIAIGDPESVPAGQYGKEAFMEFLQSDEALDVFKAAGFTVNSQQ